MEDVHLLALHYHWTEAAILALPKWKRQRYLALLARHFSQQSSGEYEA